MCIDRSYYTDNNSGPIEFAGLYQDHSPSEEACNKLYEDLAKLCSKWYTKKRHNNWLDKLKKKRGEIHDCAQKISMFLSDTVSILILNYGLQSPWNPG